MSAKSKVNLSLDEIIKNTKKEQKGGKRNVRRGAGNTGLSRKSQGVLKRKSVGTPRKRAVLKRGSKNIGRNNNQPGLSKVNPATRRLVNNLVKKALKQVSNGPRVGSVRNVVRSRRGAIRSRGQSRNNTSLTRVSQRSRVIGRRPRIVNRAPITVVANRGGRGNRRNNRIIVARREPNPIQAQLNFLRRQQQQGQRQQLARVPVIRQQQQQVRRQIPAQRRQATRVIYVQQQRPPPVRRQQQQIIYVQQQPQRQFSRGGQRGGRGPRGGQFSRGGRFRGNQRQNNDPFFEPPNFLQRIPASSQFGRSGRGGRFIEF